MTSNEDLNFPGSSPRKSSSRTLILRANESLCNNENWEEAGNAFARQHDRDFGIIHGFENWMTEVLLQTGPEADARRERILPMWGEDPSRNPEPIFNGPNEPLDEKVRKRFFCED